MRLRSRTGFNDALSGNGYFVRPARGLTPHQRGGDEAIRPKRKPVSPDFYCLPVNRAGSRSSAQGWTQLPELFFRAFAWRSDDRRVAETPKLVKISVLPAFMRETQ